MKQYTLNQMEKAQSGFTDLYILTIADMTSLANSTDITLSKLVAGDIVFPSKMLVEVRTAVVGPTGTPTGSVGITGAVTQFTAATSVIATGYVAPTGAAAYIVTGSTNLLYDFQAGGGNGAAATAGEIWVWASISRYADRSVLKG